MEVSDIIFYFVWSGLLTYVELWQVVRRLLDDYKKDRYTVDLVLAIVFFCFYVASMVLTSYLAFGVE